MTMVKHLPSPGGGRWREAPEGGCRGRVDLESRDRDQSNIPLPPFGHLPPPGEGHGRTVLRWGLSLAVVLAAHLGGAAALLAWRVPHDTPAAPPAVMIELAPVASAPAPDPSDEAPGPKQQVSESPPPPEKPIETPPVDIETLA